MELLPLDRSPLQHCAFRRLESVEPGGTAAPDRGRDRNLVAAGSLLLEQGEHLLEEEWIPLGRRDEAPAQLVGERRCRAELLDEDPALGLAQRRQQE